MYRGVFEKPPQLPSSAGPGVNMIYLYGFMVLWFYIVNLSRFVADPCGVCLWRVCLWRVFCSVLTLTFTHHVQQHLSLLLLQGLVAYLRSFKERTRPLEGEGKEEAAQLKRFEEVRKRVRKREKE